jgi:hypothetical protein
MLIVPLLVPLILMGGTMLLERLERWLDEQPGNATTMPTQPPAAPAAALEPDRPRTRHLRIIIDQSDPRTRSKAA